MEDEHIKTHKELEELKQLALSSANIELWKKYQIHKQLREDFILEKHKMWLWVFRLVLLSITIYVLILFFEITHKWLLGDSLDLKDYAFVFLVFIWILRRILRRLNK